jgi:hypothetical protein
MHVTRLDRVACHGCWRNIYGGDEVIKENKTNHFYHKNCAKFFNINGTLTILEFE